MAGRERLRCQDRGAFAFAKDANFRQHRINLRELGSDSVLSRLRAVGECEGRGTKVGIGSDILSLIEDVSRALGPDAPEKAPEHSWSHVILLESALLADKRHTRSERDLMAKVKAGASFVIEARREGREPPYDEAQAPLAALHRHVKLRTSDEGGKVTS